MGLTNEAAFDQNLPTGKLFLALMLCLHAINLSVVHGVIVVWRSLGRAGKVAFPFCLLLGYTLLVVAQWLVFDVPLYWDSPATTGLEGAEEMTSKAFTSYLDGKSALEE